MIVEQEMIKKATMFLKNADAILITASNGLSITEGLHLFANNKAFKEVLGDFEEKYNFHNLLNGFFYPWKSPEEKWGFLARVINYYSGGYKGSDAMKNLMKIVSGKPYFIVTSNAEGHFQLAGFPEENVYEVEMSWLKMRCSRRCHKELYPTLDTVRNLAKVEVNGRIPSEFVPKCPRCGGYMELYETNPVDENIIYSWESFLNDIRGKHFVVLELGIGSRNQLIKAPIMQLVERELNASYITINLGDIYIPKEIIDRSVGIDGDLDKVLKLLANC